jgi:hypothetical protein
MSRYIWGVLLRATEAVWEDVKSLSKEAVAMLKSMGASVGKVDTRGGCVCEWIREIGPGWRVGEEGRSVDERNGEDDTREGPAFIR